MVSKGESAGAESERLTHAGLAAKHSAAPDTRAVPETAWLLPSMGPSHWSSLAVPQGSEQPANGFPISCCLNKDTQRNSWARRLQNSPGPSNAVIGALDGGLCSESTTVVKGAYGG